MAEITLAGKLWKQLITVANKNRKKPERLVEKVLRDYLAQASDEELLSRSAKSARASRSTIAEAESAIKQRRRKHP